MGLGDLIAVLAAIACLFIAIYAADAAREHVEPTDWVPYCQGHECDLLMQEPPPGIWDGVAL
jgi:hypothetical protein